mmetsp:Transcript_25546/g.60598  ORF Transcript_25546/g.60598 Transcript_25546/m.60598 type:complete len:200 (-) Transcript_25546:426-1025(-)
MVTIWLCCCTWNPAFRTSCARTRWLSPKSRRNPSSAVAPNTCAVPRPMFGPNPSDATPLFSLSPSCSVGAGSFHIRSHASRLPPACEGSGCGRSFGILLICDTRYFTPLQFGPRGRTSEDGMPPCVQKMLPSTMAAIGNTSKAALMHSQTWLPRASPKTLVQLALKQGLYAGKLFWTRISWLPRRRTILPGHSAFWARR